MKALICFRCRLSEQSFQCAFYFPLCGSHFKGRAQVRYKLTTVQNYVRRRCRKIRCCLQHNKVNNCNYAIIDPLEYIFNSGKVPTKMKTAKIIPVFKKGKTDLMSNYRPISLLSIFDKLLEKIVHNSPIAFCLPITYSMNISSDFATFIQQV